MGRRPQFAHCASWAHLIGERVLRGVEKKMKADVWVFDLDGTLLDTMETYADIAGRAIARHSNLSEAEGRQRYLDTSGDPFFMQLDMIFPDGHDEKSVINAEFEEEKRAYFFAQKLNSKVVETLWELKRGGHRICVSSNNFQELADHLHKLHPGLFDEVLGYRDDFGKGRPHFHFLQERFQTTKEKMCFIGDSLSDARRAKECGLHFIGIAGTFSAQIFQEEYPEYPVIEGFSALLQYKTGSK